MALGAGAAAAGAGVSAVGNLIGAGFDQAQQGKNHQAMGRQAAQMEPFLKQLTNFDTSGLRSAANDVMRTQGNSLDASLAQRGIYNSGSALQQHQQLNSQVLSQLAQNINQDQYQRLMGASQLISGQQGFGYVDPNGQPRGK